MSFLRHVRKICFHLMPVTKFCQAQHDIIFNGYVAFPLSLGMHLLTLMWTATIWEGIG